MGRFINLLDYFRLVNPQNWPSGWIPPGTPAWTVGFLSSFQVLDCLALQMMATSIILVLVAHTRSFTWSGLGFPVSLAQVTCIIMAAVSFAISNIFIVQAQGDDLNAATPWPRKYASASSFSDIVLRFWIYPGLFAYGFIAYPLLPWVSFTLCGVAMGEHYRDAEARSHIARTSGIHAALLWCGFAIIRGWGGAVGNLRGPPRGDVPGLNWLIGVLDVCKYPPSLAYGLWTMGENMFFLSLLSHVHTATTEREQQSLIALPASPRVTVGVAGTLNNQNESALLTNQRTWARVVLDVFLVFGRVPLFFYVLHWCTFEAIGVVFHVSGFQGLYLPYCLLIWVPVLFMCSMLCRRYGVFKDAQPTDSLWRFL